MTLWGFAVIAGAKGKQDTDWIIRVSTTLEDVLSDYEQGEWLTRVEKLALCELLNKKNSLVAFSSSIKVKFFSLRIDYL